MKRTLCLIILFSLMAVQVVAQDSNYQLKFLDRQVVLLYALPESVMVDRVIVNNSKIVDHKIRASQVEILITTIESSLEEDYISCGVFELPPDEDVVTCAFEPLAARFVRVKILASWGAETGQAGDIQIGRTGASLDGTVTDSETGKPLSGALVSLPPDTEAATDDKGVFHIPYIKPGHYSLIVHRSGYAPDVRDLNIDTTRARQLNVSLKRSMTDLFGLVHDDNGTPLASIEVTLRDTTISARTDTQGYFSFSRLKAGSTEIIFSSRGYLPRRHELMITPGVQRQLNVTMIAGQDTEPPMPLKLSPYAYHPSDPTRFGSPAQAIYLHFDEAVDRNALNLLNYRLQAWQAETVESELIPLEPPAVELIGVTLHRGDPGGRTVRLNLNYDKPLSRMPFLEITVTGIGDEADNRIPTPGRVIRNFSTELYSIPSTNGNGY